MMLETRRDLERSAYYADETRVLRNHVRRMWRGKARRRMLRAIDRHECSAVIDSIIDSIRGFSFAPDDQVDAIEIFEPYTGPKHAIGVSLEDIPKDGEGVVMIGTRLGSGVIEDVYEDGTVLVRVPMQCAPMRIVSTVVKVGA